MNNHQKFLEFNGKTITFLSVDGTYWIALKPICEALKVDVRRSRELAKNDPILGSVVSDQALQVAKNGRKQLRKVTCLPEQYIYGWLFTLQSKSPELARYKKTCYELLYNHFHGTITNRKELLIERSAVDTELHEIKKQLRESDDEKLKRLRDLKSKRKLISTQLNTIDKELVEQPSLFDKASDN